MTESRSETAWGRGREKRGQEGRIVKGHEESFKVMDIYVHYLVHT